MKKAIKDMEAGTVFKDLDQLFVRIREYVFYQGDPWYQNEHVSAVCLDGFWLAFDYRETDPEEYEIIGRIGPDGRMEETNG